jgi:aminoglycoside phosphotransferase (APT) family kinase protein
MQGTDVPVPPTVGLCDDESVNGAPFFVMEFVEGPILRSRSEAEESFDEAQRRSIGERVVDTLVAIHGTDPDQVGLGDLGRREDYVARQLRRWHGQWVKSKTHEVPLIDDVHRRLEARILEQGPATIVHGTTGSTTSSSARRARSRLSPDWEPAATLGGPLADLGLLLVYWSEASLMSHALASRGPHSLRRLPSGDEVRDRYAPIGAATSGHHSAGRACLGKPDHPPAPSCPRRRRPMASPKRDTSSLSSIGRGAWRWGWPTRLSGGWG